MVALKILENLAKAGSALLVLAIPSASRTQAEEPIAKEMKLPEKVSFNAHIRPIMSDTCFVCHGPDDEANESGFRLDSLEAASQEVASGEARLGIRPGDPNASEVYLRIIGKGDGEQMPPEDFRKKLSDYDKALFKRWIEQGAKYEQHWSYAPISRPEMPEVSVSLEDGNEIDRFVVSRLAQEGIEPSPLADRATLLRRLSLDLLGLPPTQKEVEDFLNDQSEDAYERQVDRLLSSSHYGERMAAFWLDLVRFADTVGFHGDQNQRVYAYRDYVIRAFNENKPFDQFTVEQLAGDLLEEPTTEQLVATGYLRLNMMTREGGAQPGEYLAKYKADRVRALGTAWLGSTLGCCECHNHKYDPFTIKDFYSFGAFFDDLQQWGVYSDYGYTPNKDLRGYNNDFPFPPELRFPSQELATELEALQQERDERLAKRLKKDNYPDVAWLTEQKAFLTSQPSGWKVATVDEAKSKKTRLVQMDDGSLLIKGEPQKDDLLTVELSSPVAMRALRVEALPDATHGGNVGRGEDGRFSLKLNASLAAKKVSRVVCEPRFIRIELPGKQKILSLAEVEVLATVDDKKTNIASKGKASQSSVDYKGNASLAIDGNSSGDYNDKSTTHTKTEDNPWWELDLGKSYGLQEIVLWNRTDGQYASRLKGAVIRLLDANRKEITALQPDSLEAKTTTVSVPAEVVKRETRPIKFAWSEADRRTVRRYRSGNEPLTLEETWQSGPARWQLPSEEMKLPHTAVFHFEQLTELGQDWVLQLKISSADVGRLRFSVTPFPDPVAGLPAVSEAIKEKLLSEDGWGERSDAVASLFYRQQTAVSKQEPICRTMRDQILACRSGLANTLIAQALPIDALPESRVLPRGNWQDDSGEPAPPAFPRFLPSYQQEAGNRLTRLDLAKWLTAEDNPLVARHFVNRTWKQFFGKGLSGKLDDLGNQGEWPSHPLLLDWLASEFKQDWNVKQLVKRIVMSRTYRQVSAARDDLGEIDPYNRLLAQQAARRLEAEVIRDNALAIAGSLKTSRIGGKSVFPYQPSGHYRNLQFPNRQYQNNVDHRQYRRGVYMHWQRTFLHPMLVNFDAPSRDECTADRPESNSPQQALTLLNDPTFAEAARLMAANLLVSQVGAKDEKVLSIAFKRALAREPVPAEAEGLLKHLAQQRAYFSENEEDAMKVLSVGNAEPSTASNLSLNEGVTNAELAAWTQVCRVILNLHETITRY